MLARAVTSPVASINVTILIKIEIVILYGPFVLHVQAYIILQYFDILYNFFLIHEKNLYNVQLFEDIL